LLPRHLMNGLSNLSEIYRQYFLDPTDNLIEFWKSKVKVTSGRRCAEGIHVNTGASKSVFWFELFKISVMCKNLSSCDIIHFWLLQLHVHL